MGKKARSAAQGDRPYISIFNQLSKEAMQKCKAAIATNIYKYLYSLNWQFLQVLGIGVIGKNSYKYQAFPPTESTPIPHSLSPTS
ncbi:MAG: hypothetical protein F6J93_22925 [Oscillatoria sp. SIO1A7]|nr:hypothetical protein [Oscillatoria sp. SIO1A7]